MGKYLDSKGILCVGMCLISLLAIFTARFVVHQFKRQDLTIVTFGDSTTALRGYTHIYTDILIDHLPLLLPEKRLKIVNAGIPGTRTDQGRQRFEKDVLAHQPDLVIIQFGINDAAIDVMLNPPVYTPRVPEKEFVANMQYFVHELNQIHAKIILMTPNPTCWQSKEMRAFGKPPYDINDPDGINFMLRKYAQDIRNLAANSHDTYLIDVYDAMHERIISGKPPKISDDCCHPNDRGHRITGNLLLRQIRDIYANPNAVLGWFFR